MYVWVVSAVVCLSIAGCRSNESENPKNKIVATSTYLESAIREFIPDLRQATLSGPGMCPGHFDVRPGQIEKIRNCKIFFRFDFQGSFDAKLLPLAGKKVMAVPVEVKGGLSEPGSYEGVCRQVGRALVTAKLLDEKVMEEKLRKIHERMVKLSRESKERMEQAGFVGEKILASPHQSDFCRWLGLNVVSTFIASDEVRVSHVDELVKSGKSAKIKLIVGNVPEGSRFADILADQLQARVVMLNNFPDLSRQINAFDAMVAENVDRLVRSKP